MNNLLRELERLWPGRPQQINCQSHAVIEIHCEISILVEVCKFLFCEKHCCFAGLVVEEAADQWRLRYCFYTNREGDWIHALINIPSDQSTVPSIVEFVCGADWHEREVEDLFGLSFEGHPKLGNFVLHDDEWSENVRPMRHSFDASSVKRNRRSESDFRLPKILNEEGSFTFPIGPKYSGISEPALFFLETVGEDVVRSNPRLFYKWRAIEKIAEGKNITDGLALAERFAATTAFAHGLAFCLAVETVGKVKIPPRAQALRVFIAELERIRHHVGAIQDVCESTALAVAASQMAILEEDLLRISGALTGHRYLFGLLAPGGLLCDLSDESCRQCLAQVQQVVRKIEELEKKLCVSSSFLDRLEQVGMITFLEAQSYGILGPVARASGHANDMRRSHPYLGYQDFRFDVPVEEEGDGYARLRILFREVKESMGIMEQAMSNFPRGDVFAPVGKCEGAALGWVEAPRGGAFHWVRVSKDGRILRYRIIPPSFSNWHGFHLAAEKFAFQDFPIILSTFFLSIAENDR